MLHFTIASLGRVSGLAGSSGRSRAGNFLLENLTRANAQVGQRVQGFAHAEGGRVNVHAQAREAAVEVGGQVLVDDVVHLGADEAAAPFRFVRGLMRLGFGGMTIFFVSVT